MALNVFHSIDDKFAFVRAIDEAIYPTAVRLNFRRNIATVILNVNISFSGRADALFPAFGSGALVFHDAPKITAINSGIVAGGIHSAHGVLFRQNNKVFHSKNSFLLVLWF